MKVLTVVLAICMLSIIGCEKGSSYKPEPFDPNAEPKSYSIESRTRQEVDPTIGMPLATPTPTPTPSPAYYFSKGFSAYESAESNSDEDYKVAAKWFVLAAEQGHDEAQYYLGKIYYQEGTYLLRDYESAIKWFTPLAEEGHAEAQYYLGEIYRKGEGVLENYITAIEWYTRSAEQNLSDAQYALGWMYERGQGAPQDYATSIKWFTRAAEQGNRSAQFHLAEVYSRGDRGLPKNYIYAHMWYNIVSGYSADWRRGDLEKRMTTDEVNTDQRLAVECVAKEFKGCMTSY